MDAQIGKIVWVDDFDDDDNKEEEMAENTNLNEANFSADGKQLPKTSNMPLDINIYATRKTVAQGMIDIALLASNSSQLKYVLVNPSSHRYLEVTVSLITLSLILQIIVGIILIFLGRWNLNYRGDHRKCDLANNICIILIFLITVVNVLISSFSSGVPNPKQFPTYTINQNNLPTAAVPLSFKMREASKS